MNPANLDFVFPFTERTPRVVNAAKLHRAAHRRKTGRFLIEGRNCLEMAMATGCLTDIFVTEAGAERHEDLLVDAITQDIYLHAITDTAGKHLADTTTPSGVFGVCHSVVRELPPDTLDVEQRDSDVPPLILVAIEVSDPGNAGTLIRLADAFAADAMIFAGDCVDPHSGKTTRASAGSLFNLPVYRNPDIAEVLDILRGQRCIIAATTPAGEMTLTSEEASTVAAGPVAWLVGNEAHGLPDEVLRAADARINLPIPGRAESLNVAAAASVCLWESSKARHQAG